MTTMETGNIHAYFALTGDSFEPKIVTETIGISPTEIRTQGNKGKCKPTLDFSFRKLSTDKGRKCVNGGQFGG